MLQRDSARPSAPYDRGSCVAFAFPSHKGPSHGIRIQSRIVQGMHTSQLDKDGRWGGGILGEGWLLHTRLLAMISVVIDISGDHKLATS